MKYFVLGFMYGFMYGVNWFCVAFFATLFIFDQYEEYKCKRSISTSQT